MIPEVPAKRSEERATERSAAAKATRFWEVDAARGGAILMMALYHLLFDLDTFGGYGIRSTSGFWARFADATAFAFVFLVGVSLAISFARAGKQRPGQSLFGKFLLRGARIFGYGMILTGVTWVLGMGIIIFGILHLIGVSIILAYPFLRFRLLTLSTGIVVIIIGVYVEVQGFSSASVWPLVFGVVPEGIVMPDYRPILPWFGVALLGVFAGGLVYGREEGERWRFERPAFARPLSFLGRYSLLFYFVHQPIIIAALTAFGVIRLGPL